MNIMPIFEKKSDNCPVKSIDGLINKIETDLSWDMFDEYGNYTALHNALVEIIREYCEGKE